jgi:hypothetical protein
MMLHFAQAASVGVSYSHADTTQRAGQVARRLYQRACTSGWLGQMWTVLTGRPRHLLNLAEIEANNPAGNRYSIGLQAVPLRQIRGSQGRCQDFDLDFYPLQDHLKSRWLRVATAWRLGISLPPVELVQVDDIYYVRDGHHRISVARALGQIEIYAEVRVWQSKD